MIIYRIHVKHPWIDVISKVYGKTQQHDSNSLLRHVGSRQRRWQQWQHGCCSRVCRLECLENERCIEYKRRQPLRPGSWCWCQSRIQELDDIAHTVAESHVVQVLHQHWGELQCATKIVSTIDEADPGESFVVVYDWKWMNFEEFTGSLESRMSEKRKYNNMADLAKP